MYCCIALQGISYSSSHLKKTLVDEEDFIDFSALLSLILDSNNESLKKYIRV